MLLSGLLLGLFGSLHCVGMCGPITFIVPYDRTNKYWRGVQLLLFQTGRIFTYTLFGILFGLLGSGLQLFGLQQGLSMGVGIILVLSVFLPLAFKKKWEQKLALKQLNHYISLIWKRFAQRKSVIGFLIMGMVNGLLPCGLVYVALFSALALSNLYQSAMFMFLFGLGTLPLLILFYYFSTNLSPKIRSLGIRFIPAVIVVMGLLFIARGLGLGIPMISPKPAQLNNMESHKSHMMVENYPHLISINELQNK